MFEFAVVAAAVRDWKRYEEPMHPDESDAIAVATKERIINTSCSVLGEPTEKSEKQRRKKDVRK